MEPGAYIFCRPIQGGGVIGKLIRPAHQFIVCVPAAAAALGGMTASVEGVNCLIIGAYNVDGYLRAATFATTDTGYVAQKIRNPNDNSVQSSKVAVQACLVSMNDDPFLAAIYNCYQYYRSIEGQGREITYPADEFEQLNSSKFNSNSWAQSLIHWTSTLVAPGLAIRDFDGSDVGNDRLIPKQYFVRS